MVSHHFGQFLALVHCVGTGGNPVSCVDIWYCTVLAKG